ALLPAYKRGSSSAHSVTVLIGGRLNSYQRPEIENCQVSD
ncbi:hypothetical protein LSH36_268g03009, partial [Paralvinella palmiformis]